MKLAIEDLVDLARGAALLGTGGGGDPYIGRLMAQEAIRECGMPEIVELEDVPDDAQVFTSAMLGAPSVLIEKIASGDDVETSVRKLEERLGRRADFITPIEIGGCNSMIPIVAAARLGIPLVNADGMGRAFPELQMVTFNVYGVSATPLAMVDENLSSVVIETNSAKAAEDFARVNAVQMGLSVMISCYPMLGHELKKTGVPGTLTMALNIGRAIAEGRKSGNPAESLIAFLKTNPYYGRCKILFTGKITDLRRDTSRGFTIGECTLQAIDAQDVMKITFQNENLVAKVNGRTAAIVPDLICIMDSETAEPITTEALKYGQRVSVVGMSAAPVMRTPEALSIFGPSCFGLKEEFTPIEILHADIAEAEDVKI